MKLETLDISALTAKVDADTQLKEVATKLADKIIAIAKEQDRPLNYMRVRLRWRVYATVPLLSLYEVLVATDDRTTLDWLLEKLGFKRGYRGYLIRAIMRVLTNHYLFKSIGDEERMVDVVLIDHRYHTIQEIILAKREGDNAGTGRQDEQETTTA